MKSQRARRCRARFRWVLAGAVTIGLTVGGCTFTEPGTGKSLGGTNTLERVKEDRSINVGFANERPYAYRDHGDLVGQAPAVQGYIFDQIGGIALNPTMFEFGSLIQALNSERVDVVTAGMFITPDRCKQASFSNPVYVATTSLLVPAANPKGLTDYQSVIDTGARLAVMNGAAEVGQATGSGVPDRQLQLVADQQAGLDAVKSGRADAFALTSISLRALAAGDGGLAVGQAFVPVIDGKEQVNAGAAVFRQRDVALREAFNAQLAELIRSDKWLELVEPYGFTEAERPDPELTAEQLCRG
ncbi:ectoine/hydroxyectoine ABC transporter substrate-binding protein EhuB [[Mycobacterium] wendilense]|uniref:Ectoine/hydroxyectoine ABC transporter substrate-binding protein EhuB n=1 Tax=[Mycobacterium] wendilense TaxID=3064284 RepID=A0ABM9MBU7_9MYCO|nr:ectoine/hydroxyectoine ABC transporter substrate-binding protein EhuB [Mycolicibacterium sp. MU0050]CAJ1581397.1 ectoine/hydroxyectoine ABC transporter substrate-binding protein EhuB [Mycolicibacterium sp. MU0050]